MYARILVPTDGSATSDLGVNEAVRLAKSLGSRIRLVHVVNEGSLVGPYPVGDTFDRMLEELRAHGNSILESAQATVRKAQVPVETQLLEAYGGAASEPILREAASWRADLIVCGTHGRRGLRRIVLGSDAEYIVRQSPVPVLLVRAG
jgi:nucleotide-binding universal stress UspA family protein